MDVILVHKLLIEHLDRDCTCGVCCGSCFENFAKITSSDLLADGVGLAETIGPSLDFDGASS